MSEYITLQDIHKKYGLARTTVVNRCEKMGIFTIPLTKYYKTGRAPVGILKTELEKILNFQRKARKNVTRAQDIAKEIGVHYSTIINWCEELQITVHKDNLGKGCFNFINNKDIPALIKRKGNAPKKDGSCFNRTKSDPGDWNRDHHLYHKITNYAGMIPA